MRIVVTGASGLIGSALVPALRADGHDVLVLVRREPAGKDEIRWDPTSGTLDPSSLAGVDAAVHLAGAGVGDHRWTPAYKKTVLDSRVLSTTLLARTLAGLDKRPAVLLSASAVGWYGDTGDRSVDEAAPAGNGFLADVTVAWEAATRDAENARIRVCHLRTGIVLSTRGGALGRQLPLFKFGVGGRLGSGKQYQSWISIVDELAAIRFLLTAGDVSGAVNLTAPNPVTNATFTKELAAAMHRPSLAAVPGFALKIVLGGFADEGVLAGQRVLPTVLTDAGYTFAHSEIAAALRDMLDSGF